MPAVKCSTSWGTGEPNKERQIIPTQPRDLGYHVPTVTPHWPRQASSTPYQPKPTDPFSLEESAGVMEAAQSQFDAVVKERADKEAAKAAEVKRLAEEELDGFYDERTDEVSTVVPIVFIILILAIQVVVQLLSC